MDQVNIEGVILTPLKVIKHELGDVMHCIKRGDESFSGFGEAYFSSIKKGAIKGWKRHNRYKLNLTVPVGLVRFVLVDQRPDSPSLDIQEEFQVGIDGEYLRLTVPEGIWMGFQGLGDSNIIMNIIPGEHEPNEATNLELSKLVYKWPQVSP